VTDVQPIVAQSADAAGLHATAPALLLELQTQLGYLCATATGATERGRRPFRPPADWGVRLGQLAYGVYLLADQTGVQIDAETIAAAQAVQEHAAAASGPDTGWPFSPS
jgi:hypothetical protein